MMKNNINRLLLACVFAVTTFSCEEPEVDSEVTSFEKVALTSASGGAITPITVTEDDGTYEFDFKLSPNQVNAIHIVVSTGDESSSTEGEDFDIETHDVELDAFEGQDGFSIGITVYDDLIDGEKDETVYLTLTTETPSGLPTTQFLAVTIKDSGNIPPPPSLLDQIHITADWSDVDFYIEEITGCELADVDIYITDEGITTAISTAGATGACPESFDLNLSAAGNGTYLILADLYEVYYPDLGTLGPVDLPVKLTFERGYTEGDDVNTLEFAQATGFLKTDDPEGAPDGLVTFVVIAEIHYEDGVYTIIDQNDNETAMRMNPLEMKEKIMALRKQAGRMKPIK